VNRYGCERVGREAGCGPTEASKRPPDEVAETTATSELRGFLTKHLWEESGGSYRKLVSRSGAPVESA